MKKNHINFISGFVVFMSVVTVVNAQIQSTVSGGSWNNASTWIGGVVPGSANDVVINGPVYCSSDACNNVIIQAAGGLYNDYYSGSLTVFGNITNYGTIDNYMSIFYLNIHGNIINNNIWTDSYVQLVGAGDQHISSLGSNHFSGFPWTNGKSSGNLYIDTDVFFKNIELHLSGIQLYVQPGCTLSFENTLLYQCNLEGLGAGATLMGYGSPNSNAFRISASDLKNLTLEGSIDIGELCSAHGTIINNAHLQNDYYHYAFNLYDDFINNGVIQNNVGGITLDIYGNITNNNVIDINAMNFYGSGDQQISLLSGKNLSPVNFTSFKPSGKIVALTDLSFNDVVINMDNDTLMMPDNGLLNLNGGYLANTRLVDTDNDNGYIQLNFGNYAYLDNCTVVNPEVLGTVEIGNNNSFYGNILVTGIMCNNYYYYVLTIDGNLTNNGAIQNYVGGFALDISGNIVNNGICENYSVNINGTSDQHVTCLNDNPFDCYQFISSKPSGIVYFDDQVIFNEVQVDFQGNQLELPMNSTLSLHNGYLLRGNIQGNGSTSVIHGDGAYEGVGHFIQFSTLEDIRFTGEWAISNDVELYGTIINDAVLQNAYYSLSVEVYADFINNGAIRNYVGGLTMKMYSNFTNNNIWKGHSINLHGTGDQTIELAENMVFEPIDFTSYKPSGQIISTNDLEFSNTLISMNYSQLVLPEQGTLRISGQYLQHADIMAQSGRFNLVTSNYAFLNSCQFQDVTLYGDIYLQENTFNGTTINYGTMQNNYYAFTANFYGDLINFGTIQHYASAFIVNAHANIINNGNWNNIYTKMVGTTDQYIHLNNGHGINGEMYLFSDISGSSYQWYFNTWAISTLFPDPDPFSGYTGAELKFNVPVANPWAGEYKCWVDGNFSRKIIVDYTTTPRLDITALLEGPFNGSEMNTDLNGMIPHQQSLGIIGYGGPETVTAIPNGDIVDWIGLELRDAPDANSATEGTTIAGGAYFLLNDGSIVCLDGYSMPSFDITINNQLFVLIWHRNHLPVMSKYPLTESGGIYSYDFTTSAGQAYGDNQSDLGGGYFGMIGGNANGDGEINEFDGSEKWIPEAGQSGYLQSDVNMDSQVDNNDKNDIWFKNKGKFEILPD
ncbi:MAG: hypothetical protein JW731_00590 [Bacteroidales bacterium]|nr:hypothetical protein [Bacteroidales bacterium]